MPLVSGINSLIFITVVPCVCLSTHSPSGQCGEEDHGSPLPMGDSYSPRLAKHALVLGSCEFVVPEPIASSSSARSVESAL